MNKNFEKEMKGQFADAVIERAWNEALEKTGGKETDKTFKMAALLLRKMSRGAANNAVFTMVTGPQHKWRQMRMQAVVEFNENADEALANGFGMLIDPENGIAQTLTKDGEVVELDHIEIDKDMIELESGAYVAPYDFREKFGNRANPGYLERMYETNPRFALGVCEAGGTARVAVLRMNDHFDHPTSEIEVPIGEPVQVSNTVIDDGFIDVIMNSTPNMQIIPGDPAIDDFVVEELMIPTPLTDLKAKIDEFVIIKGTVFDIAKRTMDARSHIVWLAGDSYTKDDETAVFVTTDWDMDDVDFGDEIQVVGRVFESRQGIAVDCTMFGKV